ISNTNKKDTKKIAAYILIASGALGNLVDRILHGFVIDFIDIHIDHYHFAVFNIADCSIFIGISIIIIINIYNLYQNKIKNT
ncbi:signal peptidase II, partial [Buchnera aphidicola]|nr:signal peptidase II [Buchnera aphidicola]